ncbi:MAG TPA: hypothetical protein VIL88_16435 [Devosia sp.]|jgi:hypothetical protein|uniref:hypothetical protein n=1 Tax=Devosia sp. TaxID=1871048 RepID=UPI002F924D54
MVAEGGETPTSELRRFPRALAIVLFGPLVGALAAFAFFMLLNVGDPPPPDDLLYAVFSMLLITLAIGWVTGLPAAALSALVWHFLEPRLRGAARVLAALVIGAVTSLATSLPIIYIVFGGTFFNFNGFALVGTIGALSMVATALPGRTAR